MLCYIMLLCRKYIFIASYMADCRAETIDMLGCYEFNDFLWQSLTYICKVYLIFLFKLFSSYSKRCGENLGTKHSVFRFTLQIFVKLFYFLLIWLIKNDIEFYPLNRKLSDISQYFILFSVICRMYK